MTTLIEIGDTVTTPSGDNGVVTSIDKQLRTHFIRRCYNVRLDNGSLELFEEIISRDDRGKDLARTLDLAKPAEEKAPAKPPAAKPKEETRHAREA